MKLGIAIASFRALGEDEPEAIVQLLRSGGPQHGLSPLEEARFVDELHSVREIDGLAHGFFRGPDSFRQEILQGNLKLALQLMDQMPPDPEGCSEFERIFIQDLESLQKGVLRILSKSHEGAAPKPRLHGSCQPSERRHPQPEHGFSQQPTNPL